MFPLLFGLTSWLVVTLPLTLILQPFVSLSALGVATISIAAVFPYGALLWRAMQAPHPRLRNLLVQGLTLGHASAGGLLISAPLALTAVAAWRPVAAVVLALAIGVFGVVAATRPRLRFLRFDAPQLSSAVRLVQLTDVHLGSRGPSVLTHAMKIALAQTPDAIVITGDLVDGGEVGRAELAPLAASPVPIYMVIGNHERYVNLETLLVDIDAQGVTVLRDAQLDLGKLQLLGVDDSDTPHYLKSVLPDLTVREDAFSVLLYHKPDDWEAARNSGVDLMLSGHTHAGQVWPFSHLVTRRHPEWRGLYERAGRHLYVSPGTGCWGPIYRIGSWAEVTVIDLAP